MFKCKLSESAYQREVVRRLFDEPLTQHLPFVELQPGTPLFHIEVAPIDQIEQWRSLLFCDLKEVWRYCQREKAVILGASVRMHTSKREQAKFACIHKIKTATLLSGEEVEILTCEDGDEIVLCDGVLTDKEFEQENVVWASSKYGGV